MGELSKVEFFQDTSSAQAKRSPRCASALRALQARGSKGAPSRLRSLGLSLALAVSVSCTLLACAKGGSFKNGSYKDDEVAFQIPEPGSDYRKLKADDAKVALQNERSGSTMAINARCGKDGDDVPLRALVQHLFLQFTDRQLVSEREFILDGRAALEMEMKARLDGVSRHFIVVVMKKDGCVFDFIYIDGNVSAGSTTAQVEADRAEFRKMVAGFQSTGQSS